MSDILKRETSGTLLVGWDTSHGVHKTVLIVGKPKKDGNADIVNYFEGEDANALLSMLLERKDKAK